MSFDTIIQEINENNTQQRDRGTAFEYLVKAYLKNEPTYKNLFQEVWMLSEVPESEDIPKKDTGVDLVAKKFTGELVAVQAKFYDHKLYKQDIDSFLSEINKDYYAEGLIVSSTDDWGANAEQAIEGLSKSISRIGLSDLRNSQIDWDKFSFVSSEKIQVKQSKKLRDYQEKAISNSLEYFKKYDRGQLIMAPGTGKTFTSLKIAEAMANESDNETFSILYLVPSIQLLTQTLRAWNNDTDLSISSMAVTSDRNASRQSLDEEEKNLFVKAQDIGFPATTSTAQVLKNYEEIKKAEPTNLLVVFSTYQSIDVLGQAQKEGFPEFDLIIADEAHRTTGARLEDQDDSAFTKVHSNDNIKGKLRLYQTATPKVYGQEAKNTANEQSVVAASMDDESIYGTQIFRLGFGDAIGRGILTDYKLMVLAVNESGIRKELQQTMQGDNGLNLDDIGRIIGVWNGMIKRNSDSDTYWGAPMKRAIAFTRTIADSKLITDKFDMVVNDYLSESDNEFSVDVHHADGTMNALQKNTELDWLKSDDIPENEARILSNVRFLTEGIDVPNLDAIIFLSSRKSQVDIVQAVGRVVRKAEDKDYGYIIIPVVVPDGVDPASILDNSQNYDVIWQILNALRSVDERFQATINKLQYNKKKSSQINIIDVNAAPADSSDDVQEVSEVAETPQGYHIATRGKNKGKYIKNRSTTSYTQDETLDEWTELEGVIYGKIVQKLGNRAYLEDWSEDVGKIARRHIEYMNTLIGTVPAIAQEFDKFVQSLKHNINDSITQEQAVEMLAQHMITKPVFDALFDEYSVVRKNPVNDAMEKIIDELANFGFDKEQKELQPFYESVQMRASGIDNAEAKQKIIVTLYDKFFRTGFKKTTDRLGIVFTPVEVVDFIVHSVDDVLRKYFGKTIASKGVHILDPFTGTGTFITRTLQYLKDLMDKGEIKLEDILEKYVNELHANEIVLLSYYIAAINIEAVFDEINGDELDYEPFEGIVLTDTFQSTESEDVLDDDFFRGNDERLKRQQEVPITAILGNPPYSGGQQSSNDNNANLSYEKLDSRIRETYVQNSTSNNNNYSYDSYIRAIRWSSDRLSTKGVIGFVSNASYIDSQSADGLRHSLYNEFNHLYIFNLRGDQRTVGEQSRKEGGKIFGSGSRTPIAISILVKDGTDKHEIHYRDIGDYLNRDQKLLILTETKTIEKIDWSEIIPDKNNDWINQRDENYLDYVPVYSTEDSEKIFNVSSMGVQTKRDKWIYNFSKTSLDSNISRMIENYNSEVKRLGQDENPLSLINTNENYIKWSDELKRKFLNGYIIENSKNYVISQYRPFTKKYLLYSRDLIARPGKFDNWNTENKILFVMGVGANKEFSAIVTNLIPESALEANGQGFSLEANQSGDGLFNDAFNLEKRFDLSEEDLFYYVYGVLHSQEYRQKYANDLQKALPRIPLLKDKEKYVEIGRKLADLHLNYEHQPSWEGVIVTGVESGNFRVKKMKHPKVRNSEGKSVNDLTKIIFNENITISNIPEQAYEYVVNGRPAVEWIIDQYQVKTDKKSGITDDPNDFAPENPRYILDLLLSVITVSMKTVELVAQLPKMEVADE
ncbi:helicase [Lactococcus lactis]|uniref:DEAD/DEAH box helicase n=3 Tax=Lactococcus TaxID=1357 RepID=UPI0002F760D9|nr:MULTISPECIES: type ISP restriction/modification enzyme [Lactococcus]KWT46551.1 helicase [Lactococcus lactis]